MRKWMCGLLVALAAAGVAGCEIRIGEPEPEPPGWNDPASLAPLIDSIGNLIRGLTPPED